MFSTARRTAVAVAGVGALALGGSALADAASQGSSSSSSSAAPQQQGYGTPPSGAQAPGGRGGPGAPGGGRHVGANGKREQALSASVAAKVKAAALARVSGGTVERVETDVDHGSPYEAHVRKADGTQLEVLVNERFQVTALNTMGR